MELRYEKDYLKRSVSGDESWLHFCEPLNFRAASGKETLLAYTKCPPDVHRKQAKRACIYYNGCANKSGR